jgi:radical SAM protein with 4Fe4S-binding SPASM domain
MDKNKKNQLFPDVLTTKKKKTFLLEKSKTFCMLPWVHMYVNPNGDVLPCCIANHTTPIGNIRGRAVKDVWTDAPYKVLRTSMINGVKTEHCTNCYQHEESGGGSMRTWANQLFGKHIDVLDNMGYDGSMPTLDWKYFDVRFSNICNFKCRTCNDHFSSSWVEEDNKHNAKEGSNRITMLQNASSDAYPLMPQILPMMPNMEIINFAGGEPLITPEHYEVLEYLIEQKSTQMQLKYSSNLSGLKYKSKDIIELWKHFPDIMLMASLDSTGARAEYIRSGTIWANQVANLKKIKEVLPHIKLTFSAVISIFNVLTITDTLDELRELGVFNIESDDMSPPTLYRLTGPAPLNIKVLDAETKQLATDKLQTWLDNNLMVRDAIRSNIKDVIDYMKEDWTHLMPETKKEIDRVDARRGESFIKTFPELERFYNLCGEDNVK